MIFLRLVHIRCCIFITLINALWMPTKAVAQKAYFIDGYHGGKWGHYPQDFTQYLLTKLTEYPTWKLNLEIEPETWDWVKQVDPISYQTVVKMAADQTTGRSIEYVNPAYGQPYMYNISGESIIRQLSYGMQQLRKHFPTLTFTTYSSEEPCFTSSLPQLLTSFGIRYASLKNPNTCWGGYVKAYGKDLITWQGPDGTNIPTSPRYGMEQLKPGSTWETIGNNNSLNYVQSAIAAGIKYPLGMCLQDAGWRNGPWLGHINSGFQPTITTLWSDYFAMVIPLVQAPVWRLSQEDIRVSLVWGSQILQRIGQQIRQSENKLLLAERSATMDYFFKQATWPGQKFDEAWRSLLLAQHHDCWIVPYNRVENSNWAEKVAQWTAATLRSANQVLTPAKHQAVAGTSLTIRNTLPYTQNGQLNYSFKGSKTDTNLVVFDSQGRAQPTQWSKRVDGTGTDLLFLATIPAMADRLYHLKKSKRNMGKSFVNLHKAGTNYFIESDQYQICLDTAQGGVITSLKSKASLQKEWVDTNHNAGFNELRGFFYQEHAFRSSAENPATITLVEQGAVRFKLRVDGHIAGHPFTQELILVNGQPRIDFNLTIDWKGQPHIGQYEETAYKAENRNKAFYNDRYKLLLLFPTALAGQQIMKNAPFDVTESTLDNTFFSRWDSIKNNVVLDWVDEVDQKRQQGMALFTDHTTSYVHGKDHPLGLTVQYAGKGLWGKDYQVDGPTQISYSLMPHAKTWDQAQLWQEDDRMKSPLLITDDYLQYQTPTSLVAFDKVGYQLSALYIEDNAMIMRIFNAASDVSPLTVLVPVHPSRITMEELDGRPLQHPDAKQTPTGSYAFSIAMPRFGVRTIRLSFNDPHNL
ncbi:alpha-mannosidase [bacterium A37T11]|nr:alpha-mannosidase [bacterium A37T11]